MLTFACNKTAKEYFDEGLEYYNAKNDTEAIECFIKATELNSAYFDAYLYLGKSYYFDYQLDSAINAFLKAKTIETNDELFRRLGKTYQDIDSIPSAINTYEEGLKFYPQDDFLMFNLASCYYHNGNYNESLSLLNNLTQINPDSFDVYYLIGQNLFELNDFTKSIEYYKISIDKAPLNDFLYYDLARAYLKLNILDSALIYASKSAQLDMYDEGNLFLLSSIFLIKDMRDSAYYYYHKLEDLIISPYRKEDY